MRHTFVHENLTQLMRTFRYDAHPMGMVRLFFLSFLLCLLYLFIYLLKKPISIILLFARKIGFDNTHDSNWNHSGDCFVGRSQYFLSRSECVASRNWHLQWSRIGKLWRAIDHMFGVVQHRHSCAPRTSSHNCVRSTNKFFASSANCPQSLRVPIVIELVE